LQPGEKLAGAAQTLLKKGEFPPGAAIMQRKLSYCRHRKVYARTKINGQWVHLGRYGSEESQARFRQLAAEFAASLQAAPAPNDDTTTIVELLAGYFQFAEVYYASNPNRVAYTKRLIRIVRELYADVPVNDFGPKKLKAVRQVFIEQGWVRKKVNEATRDVIAMFSWGVEQELVPGSVVHALREVRGLRKGRSEAPESKRIRPVPQADVNATCEHLPPVLGDMVTVQELTGCRPAEVCTMTPGEIDRSGEVWLYRPEHHKTAHLDHDRVIAIGPKCQQVLKRYLLRADDSPCFSPKEAMRQRLEQQHAERKTPLSYGNKPDERKRQALLDSLGDRYDVPTYRRAIHRACDRAFPAPEGTKGRELEKWRSEHRWSPNRLRHTRATEVRQHYGLDAVQAVLGHRHARISEVYGELNTAKAVAVAQDIG
jgi:integrase